MLLRQVSVLVALNVGRKGLDLRVPLEASGLIFRLQPSCLKFEQFQHLSRFKIWNGIPDICRLHIVYKLRL